MYLPKPSRGKSTVLKKKTGVKHDGQKTQRVSGKKKKSTNTNIYIPSNNKICGKEKDSKQPAVVLCTSVKHLFLRSLSVEKKKRRTVKMQFSLFFFK